MWNATKRILIVEDEPMILLDLELTLTQLGHTAIGASTVGDAALIMATEKIDLAILDYHLQQGTTVPVADQLRLRGIPFVLCTGTASPDELDEVFRGPIVLSKPYTIEGLEHAVRSASSSMMSEGEEA